MTHKLGNPADLPVSTAWLFPEYNFANMDVRRHRYVIMERILERGDWNEVNWLFDQYSTRGVRAWMRRWGFRALSRRSFALWKLVLNIRRFDAPAWALDAKRTSGDLMPTIVNPHWDMITPGCRQALDALRDRPFIRSFYLAGGTALALQIGHRVSKDLDWFSATIRLEQRK